MTDPFLAGTLARLDEIEEAASKATPGPWKWQGEDYRGGWGWQLLVAGDGSGILCGEDAGKPYAQLRAYVPIDPEYCRTGMNATKESAPAVHVLQRDAAFIAACDPQTVLALVRIARAAVEMLNYCSVDNLGNPIVVEMESALHDAGLIT